METKKSAKTTEANTAILHLIEKTITQIDEIFPEFDHYLPKLRELADRCREGRFHLAVLGQFKRGKSTLLNALIGEPILPVGILPLTASPTFLRYGKSPMVSVELEGGEESETFHGNTTAERREFLKTFVTEAKNSKNFRKVREVTVDLPAQILSHGVVLIDTPGIGSTYRHNTQATIQFLKQCDAALFLISADPPITEVELEFLKEVKEKIPRLFFVLNKIDYLNDEERAEALGFYENVLVEQAKWDQRLTIFSVSARNGLEAVSAGDENKWKESGMADLETFLVDFLVRKKFEAIADAASLRGIDFIENMLMDAGIRLEALKLPRETLEQKIAVFEQSLEQAESDRELIQDVLEGDKKRIGAFVEQQAKELRKNAFQFLEDIRHCRPGSLTYGKSSRKEIQKAWAEAIPDFFEQQRAELNDRVRSRLVESIGFHEERLSKLIETLRKTAADLFSVPYQPEGRENVLEVRNKPYWVLSTWNTDPLPFLKSMDQRMEDLVRRNVENIRWSLLQNLNVSFAKFTSRVLNRLEETVAATKGGMESALILRKEYGESLESEIQRWEDGKIRLNKLKGDFTQFRNRTAEN